MFLKIVLFIQYMKKIFKLCLCLITATFIISIFNACKPEPEPQTPGSVSVTTSSVSNITETSAKCGGTVTASGYSVGNCGLCYSELPNPTVSSYITSDQLGTGTFTSTMRGTRPPTVSSISSKVISLSFLALGAIRGSVV